MEAPKENKFNKPLFVFRIKTPKVFEITKKMIEFLIQNNFVEYIYLEKTSNINSQIIFGNNYKDKYFREFKKETEDSNLCIIIGGDGTCLWANALYDKRKQKPPYLCFQGGNLGFLAIYDPEDYENKLRELYTTDNYRYIHRKEISCIVYEKEGETNGEEKIDDINNFKGYKIKASYTALNELYLEKKANMSHLVIFIEDNKLATVSSDGVIFATPTGSTAYSLSAGGPILHNDVDGIIITAICPFSLSFRPIVLPQNIKLRVKNDKEYNNSYSIIKMDGQDKGLLYNNQFLEISLTKSCIDFIVLKSTEDNLDKLWMQKISKSLGWNYAFSH